jgi:hypothetical protein
MLPREGIHMKVCLAILIALLMSTALSAEPLAKSNGEAASQPPAVQLPLIKLVINGKEIPGVLLNVEGRKYVLVDDLVKGLGYAIRVSENKIELFDVEAGTNQGNKEVQPKTGILRGVMTYTVLWLIQGSSPTTAADIGAKVWLVNGKVTIPEEVGFHVDGKTLTLEFPDGTKTLQAVGYAVADGTGAYEIKDIPPGEYTIVARSMNAGPPRLQGQRSKRDIGGMVRTQEITINADVVSDGSLRFLTVR